MASSLDARAVPRLRCTAMKQWLSLFLLAAACGAHAAPASAEDDVGRFMAEKGLVDRLEQARVNMAGRSASSPPSSMRGRARSGYGGSSS